MGTKLFLTLFLILGSLCLIDSKACILRLNVKDGETDWDEKVFMEELKLDAASVFKTKDSTNNNVKYKDAADFLPELGKYIHTNILEAGFTDIYIIGHAAGTLSIMSGAKGGSIVEIEVDAFRDIFAAAKTMVNVYLFTCASAMTSKDNVKVVFSSDELLYIAFPWIKASNARKLGFLVAPVDTPFIDDLLVPYHELYAKGDNLGKISDAMILAASPPATNPIAGAGIKFLPFGDWAAKLVAIDYGDWNVAKTKPASYDFEIAFREKRVGFQKKNKFFNQKTLG